MKTLASLGRDELLARAARFLPAEAEDQDAVFGSVVLSPYEAVRAKAARYLHGLPDIAPAVASEPEE